MKDWKKIIKIIFGTILLYIFHPNKTFKYLIDYYQKRAKILNQTSKSMLK